MQLFERLARSLGYNPKPKAPLEFRIIYRETFKRWRYQPNAPLMIKGNRHVLVANRGGMFLGDEHDFCATVAYMVGGSLGEVKFRGGERKPVAQYQGWICEAGVPPYPAAELATKGQILVTFPIRSMSACKALGYELLIQGV